MNKPEAEASQWLRKASSDLLNIRNNLSAEHIPWDTVCFHAQQAVEKTLKAFLVFHGLEPPRTHDLVALLTASLAIEPMLEDLETECLELTYFAVSVRYPDDLFEPTEDDGMAMMTAAHRVCARVRELIPES